MVVVAVIVLWVMIGLGGFMWLRSSAQRERTYERFEQATRTIESRTISSGSNSQASDAEGTDESEVRGIRRLSRNWIWLPWVIGIGVAATIWLVFRWPVQYVVAIGAVVSLLLSQLESFLHTRHIAILERQLADAIDIMVGAVSAGAGVGPAIDAATVETDRPLKLYLAELSGRIRLGDEPLMVFRSLADRVPLETFLLFASSLAVHYEVGGRLAPTLATVGRTIRDRIEVTRRIQSNIAQSQFSTFAILGLVYLIALIVWRSGPEPMREFVTSTVGSWFVAGSIIMQAVGIVWMNLISKPKF
ncbi:MAG: pilus assembly protein TadB [Planctomycetes bacterium]|nr:pilus assembly protein TadB [Planctomycetota bacterium]